MSLRVMTIYGTRPEVIKVAPIISAIRDSGDMECITVVSGQHREMVDQVHSLFGIVPDHDLDIMTVGQSLNQILSRVIRGVDKVLAQEPPDVVLVQGDTSTVVGAAVAAFNRKVPVVHLEAGLRSGDLASPFPEEANRRLTSQVAVLHLAPTATSRANLLAEGISSEDVVVCGNTVIDALRRIASAHEAPFIDPRLEELEVLPTGRKIVLVTAHRRENLDERLEQIALAVADIATTLPEAVIVLPMHRNPRVREVFPAVLSGLNNVLLLEPLTYRDFTRVLKLAHVVVTDSGGIQEEAPSLGKPVLVLRENTERPEAVEAGTVKLVGTRRARIVAEVSSLLRDDTVYRGMATAVNPYGDGRAAQRTLAALRWKFLGGERPSDFSPRIDDVPRCPPAISS